MDLYKTYWKTQDQLYDARTHIREKSRALGDSQWC